jgi:cytochrome c biogenesis protein ResB
VGSAKETTPTTSNNKSKPSHSQKTQQKEIKDTKKTAVPKAPVKKQSKIGTLFFLLSSTYSLCYFITFPVFLCKNNSFCLTFNFLVYISFVYKAAKIAAIKAEEERIRLEEERRIKEEEERERKRLEELQRLKELKLKQRQEKKVKSMFYCTFFIFINSFHSSLLTLFYVQLCLCLFLGEEGKTKRRNAKETRRRTSSENSHAVRWKSYHSCT